MPTLEQMKIRQSVLADFGDFALRCDDLDDVLHEACRLASDALGTDLAKVLEIEGRRGSVRQGRHWLAGGRGHEIDVADVDLGPEAAVPIGLIANELVTNSLRHAFDDEGGVIRVTLKSNGDRLHLCFRTTAGACRQIRMAQRLVQALESGSFEGLAGQLGAELTWPASDVGTTLCLDLDQAEQ